MARSLFSTSVETRSPRVEQLAKLACVAVILLYSCFLLMMKRLSYGIQLQFR